LPKALERTGDIVTALAEAAHAVEDKMADLTTEAFGTGVDFARKRAKA